MPATVSIILPTPIIANRTINGVVAVQDLDSSGPYTLKSCVVTEATESDAQVGPIMCAAPNQPVGSGNIVVPLGGTAYLPFSVVFTNPYGAGASPQAPGGANPSNSAANADPVFSLVATLSYALGSGANQVTASWPLNVGVSSTITPFPLAQGGGLQMQSGMNLVNFLYL